MLKYRIFLFFIAICFVSFSQEAVDPIKQYKNIIKYNPLGTAVWKSVPLFYERRANKVVAFSIGAGVIIPHTVKTSKLSFESNLLNGAFTDGKVNGYFFTPEVKFYLGGKSPKGFYVSRYIRIMSYNVKFNGVFDDNNGNLVDADISMTIKEYGAGRQFGYQWLIAERWTIDWFILGYRGSTYTFKFKADAKVTSQALIDIEQKIIDQYQAILGDVGLSYFQNKLPFTANSTSFGFSYGFGGFNLRHGIAIGFRF